MAEERGATIIGGVEAEVRVLRQDVTELKVDVAEIKGTVSQMDKRLSNVEATISREIGSLRQEIGDLRKDTKQAFYWLLGIVLTTWMGTMWAILSKIR